MTSVICAIVKNEQRFIREWVEHYLNAGFDKLYVYEDYESNSHKEQIKDYIKSGRVDLINLETSNLPIPKRGLISEGGQSTQRILYRWFFDQCKNNKIKADWIGFFDVDEFIMFEDGWNLKKLEEEFKDCAGILLSWKLYGANGHINRPEGNIVDNYTSHMPEGFLLDSTFRVNVKSLVNVQKCERLNTIHVFKDCVLTNRSQDKKLSFSKAWLNHYYSKSWEDYIERIFARGNMQNNFRSLDQFFRINPDMNDKMKEMIFSLRNRHTAATMWISRRFKIISGGNISTIAQLNNIVNAQSLN